MINTALSPSLDKQAKQEAKINKKIAELAKKPDFSAKYLKNIEVNFAHGQSTHAHTGYCSVCYETAHTAKELRDIKKNGWGRHGVGYGISFGDVFNKRHQKREPNGHLSWDKMNCIIKDICSGCLFKLETALNYKFKHNVAP